MSETPPAPPADGAETERLLKAVGAAVQANDLPQAFVLAREGLDAGIEHPGLLSLRSLWLEQQGRFDEGLVDLDRAQVLAPKDFSIQNARGLLLDKLQRPHDTVAAFTLATELEPRFAPAHHNLGWAREMVGDEAGARQAYEHAIALRPDYSEPLAHLARLAARRGDANVARIHAEQALRIDPRQPTALNALAEAELVDGDLDRAITLLQTLLSYDHVTPVDRSFAHSLLGDALDRKGEYAEAFAAYTAANQELKTLYAPRLATGRSQTTPQMLMWLNDYVSNTPAEAWRRRPEPAPDNAPAAHIFIVGLPRSGAAFLQKVLAASPAFAGFADQDALGDGVRDFMADTRDLNHLATLGAAELEPYRRAYWRRFGGDAASLAGKMVIDPLPLNAMRVPLILKLFPDAKMVFTLRDPRDVVLSCFRRRVQMNPVTYEFLTLDGAALMYDLTVRLSLLYQQKLPVKFGLVRYEDLVENAEVQLQAVCDFLGVDFADEMRSFAAVESARFATTDPQNRGFYGDIVGAWRRYAAQLQPVAQKLQPWIKQFAYAAD